MLGRNKVLVWRGRYSVALTLIVALVFTGGGLAGWSLQRSLSSDLIAGMQARIENLELRNHELNQMIDEEAVAALRSQVSDLQGQVMNQRMTIYGLQEIITPQEARAGLRIHSVNVEPGGDARDYRLSVGLTQALLSDNERCRGHLELAFAGTLDGAGHELGLDEISQLNASRIEFNFESSTELRANVTLPARFEPSKIRVRVTPSPEEQHSFEREFPWAPLAPRT
ncbi:MAG: hypothetical protein OXF94_08450 [Gammaproteobacteria bacterium]|nr:hypothetical protein [Gammaproteobacteria bacterium]MDE0245372.1 hypothetical protein [Gammaproteobacteria bacterium]